MIHCFNLTLWYSNFFKQLKVIGVRFGFVYILAFSSFVYAACYQDKYLIVNLLKKQYVSYFFLTPERFFQYVP